MPERRQFLAQLGAMAAAMTIDPDEMRAMSAARPEAPLRLYGASPKPQSPASPIAVNFLPLSCKSPQSEIQTTTPRFLPATAGYEFVRDLVQDDRLPRQSAIAGCRLVDRMRTTPCRDSTLHPSHVSRATTAIERVTTSLKRAPTDIQLATAHISHADLLCRLALLRVHLGRVD